MSRKIYNRLSLMAVSWLDESTLMPVARCLLQAVNFIHNAGFAHQDIHLGNVFVATVRNEMNPEDPGAAQFKLGDLGITKLLSDLSPQNTRAKWMLPPEVINPSEFGPIAHRNSGATSILQAPAPQNSLPRTQQSQGHPTPQKQVNSPRLQPHRKATENKLSPVQPPPSPPRLADRLRRPTLVDDFEETMRLLDGAPPEVFRQKLLARVRRILFHQRQKLPRAK